MCYKVSGGSIPNVHMFMVPGLESGSCGLEYRLVEIPKSLRDGYIDEPSSWTSFLNRGCPVTTTTI